MFENYKLIYKVNNIVYYDKYFIEKNETKILTYEIKKIGNKYYLCNEFQKNELSVNESQLISYYANCIKFEKTSKYMLKLYFINGILKNQLLTNN